MSTLAETKSGLFLNWETTLNRSHEDAVRLTRTPQVVQLRRRDRMVREVWGADSEFLAAEENTELFRQVVGRLLNARLTQELMYGDLMQAREVLKRLKESGAPISPKTHLARMLSNIPGGISLLRSLR